MDSWPVAFLAPTLSICLQISLYCPRSWETVKPRPPAVELEEQIFPWTWYCLLLSGENQETSHIFCLSFICFLPLVYERLAVFPGIQTMETLQLLAHVHVCVQLSLSIGPRTPQTAYKQLHHLDYLSPTI